MSDMNLNASTTSVARRYDTMGGVSAVNHDVREGPQVYRFVPLEGVGALVQSCLRAGMKKIVVVPNKHGGFCTLTIET
jgi:hypothetical protein